MNNLFNYKIINKLLWLVIQNTIINLYFIISNSFKYENINLYKSNIFILFNFEKWKR